MLRRVFWVALGAGAAVFGVRALRRRAAQLRPHHVAGGVSAAASDLARSLRELAAEVRAAAAEREQELFVQLGVPGEQPPPPERARP